jgi:hypothetical protein
MATNYYLHYNICECCGRQDSIHIGKFSCGWRFIFHWHHNLRNVEEIKQAMNQEGAFILDEYGRDISYEEFSNMVEEAQKDGTHDEYADIIDGYDFIGSDFS